MRSVFAYIRRGIRAGRRYLPAFGMFFLLSMAKCLSVPSPYAICCMAAYVWIGMGTAGAWAGLAAGIAFQYAWGAAPDYWHLIACAICALTVKWIKKGGAGSISPWERCFCSDPSRPASQHRTAGRSF